MRRKAKVGSKTAPKVVVRCLKSVSGLLMIVSVDNVRCEIKAIGERDLFIRCSNETPRLTLLMDAPEENTTVMAFPNKIQTHMGFGIISLS